MRHIRLESNICTNTDLIKNQQQNAIARIVDIILGKMENASDLKGIEIGQIVGFVGTQNPRKSKLKEMEKNNAE